MEVVSPTVHQIEVRDQALGARASRELARDAAALFRRGVQGVVIDLGQVSSLDARGLSTLLDVKRCVPAGARLVLARLTPGALPLPHLARLHESFDIFADVSSALASLLA